MTKQDDFKKGFATILECDAQKVVPEADLATIGNWDSMSVMQVQVLADEIFQKELDPRAISKCVTFADILALVEK